MRILCIAPFPVLPVTAGGKVRIVQLARALHRMGAEVTILAPFHPLQTRELAEREPFELKTFAYPLAIPVFLLGRRLPYGVLISRHPGLGLLLRGFIRRFDVVQFEHAFLAGLLDAVPKDHTVVYDAHNVDSDYVESECRSELARRIARRRMRFLENALLERADHVFACSGDDRTRFEEVFSVSTSKISLAPNGIAREQPNPPEVNAAEDLLPGLGRFRHRLLFSGSDVRHNVEAAEFLVRELAPRIDPQWAVVLHGSVATVPSVTAACSENVFHAPDFGHFAELAGPRTVAINPVEQGGGTNLKLTHALAHSLPVLSTPFGMRGYDDLSRYVTVQPREQFASFLRSAARFDLTELPKPPAFDELQRLYGWDGIGAAMIGRIRQVVASRSEAPAPAEQSVRTPVDLRVG